MLLSAPLQHTALPSERYLYAPWEPSPDYPRHVSSNEGKAEMRSRVVTHMCLLAWLSAVRSSVTDPALFNDCSWDGQCIQVNRNMIMR